MSKYGLKKLAHEKLTTLLTCVLAYAAQNQRIEIFAVLVGASRMNLYRRTSPRCGSALELLQRQVRVDQGAARRRPRRRGRGARPRRRDRRAARRRRRRARRRGALRPEDVELPVPRGGAARARHRGARQRDRGDARRRQDGAREDRERHDRPRRVLLARLRAYPARSRRTSGAWSARWRPGRQRSRQPRLACSSTRAAAWGARGARRTSSSIAWRSSPTTASRTTTRTARTRPRSRLSRRVRKCKRAPGGARRVV